MCPENACPRLGSVICSKESMKQERHILFLPRILSQAPSMAGVVSLVDLVIMCYTESPTLSFEFMNISHQGQFFVLLLPSIGNVLGKSWWDVAC